MYKTGTNHRTAAFLGALVTACGAALAATAADQPQTASNQAPTATDQPGTSNALDEIVVTGTAEAKGVRKQDAPYAITTANDVQIRESVPISAADVVKIIPGMYAETSAGIGGPNIEVRGFPTAGDAPWVSMQLNGMPIFPVSTLSYSDNSTLLRLDDTIARVEGTIGGPAVLWGVGQPGATVNFIEKNGEDNPGGSLRYTTGTGYLERFDAYYGGKVADGWYASIGGFYRSEGGVRNTQFPANQGYQVVGTVTHDIEDGKFTVYARTLNDNNAFYPSTPLLSTGGSNPTITRFPGFNPLTNTLLSNADRYVTFDYGPGQTQTIDLSRGRGVVDTVVGFDFQKTIDNVEFTDKFTYFTGTSYALYQSTSGNPETLAAFIQSEVTAANNKIGPVNGVLATGGIATISGVGTPISDLTQQVMSVGIVDVQNKLTGFQNEARLTIPLFAGNDLTLGTWLASYSEHSLWYGGANNLLQVTNNPQRINVILDNGVLATNNSGVVSPANSTARNNSYNGQNYAGIIADDWSPTDNFKISFGGRFEWERIDATLGDTSTGNIGASPLDLYDYGATYLNGASQGLSFDAKGQAYTVNADYEVQHGFNLFAAYNKGYALPTFDNLSNGVDVTTHVQQAQGGLKLLADSYLVHLTGFYNGFIGQPSNVTLGTGQVFYYIVSSQTEGFEVEGSVRPLKDLQIPVLTGFQLSLLGDWQHAHYTAGGAGITGNQVQRQPDLQGHFTLSDLIPLPAGAPPLKLFATANYFGKRFSDVTNLQPLPTYATLDVGASMFFQKGLELTFTGSNVTNSLGLTQGNSHVLGTGLSSTGVFLGRSIEGADYQISVAYHF